MLQVLSHHMSSKTARRYEAAQDGAHVDIRVLQFYEDCDQQEWDAKFRKKVEANTKQYLQK